MFPALKLFTCSVLDIAILNVVLSGELPHKNRIHLEFGELWVPVSLELVQKDFRTQL